MRPEFLELLVCPECEGELELRGQARANGDVTSGELVCAAAHSYPVRDSIPRFVAGPAYADAFQTEWTEFSTAHLDGSRWRDYLEAELLDYIDFPPERFKGKLVLDAGCGVGRFGEIPLDHGARVVACDLTGAIDAARANLGHREGIDFVQADIFRLPFRPEAFDMVYSLGVIHHTPDPPTAFRHLARLVKPGGKLMVFVYAKYNKAYVAVTEFYRRFARHLPTRVLLSLCYIAVPLYYVSKIPVLGPFVTRLLLPVSVRPPTHRMRVRNTFDLYSPAYSFFYDHVEVHRWFEREGLERIRPVAPDRGVSYIAVKPPVDEHAW